MTLLVCVPNFAFAQMATIDVKAIEGIAKGTKVSGDILKAGQETLDQITSVSDAIGKAGEISAPAVDAINSVSSAANTALQSCGFQDLIPNLNIEWPGLDLPNVDFSCLSSSLDFVTTALYEVNAYDPKSDLLPELRAGETRYDQVIKNKIMVKEDATKIALAMALTERNNTQDSNLLKMKLATMAKIPGTQNTILRQQTAVLLAIHAEMTKLNGQFASFMAMDAAERMAMFPVRILEPKNGGGITDALNLN